MPRRKSFATLLTEAVARQPHETKGDWMISLPVDFDKAMQEAKEQYEAQGDPKSKKSEEATE